MLIPQRQVPQIVSGDITVAFRRWRRASLQTGGTLRYSGGVLAIDEVAAIDVDEISDADAVASGAADREAVIAELNQRAEGNVYRVRFHHLGEDLRVALREDGALSDTDVAEIATRLARMDARSARGPWTRATLDLIAARPGVVAGELAKDVGVERDILKRDIRKLKDLGLTISLDVGYELSPRGCVYLQRSKPSGFPAR